MADLGLTISCLGDLDPSFAMVSGRRGLAQEIANRLISPRGSYLPDPEYGFDVRAFLNESIGIGEIFRIESGVESEALKDERVDDADATVTYIESSASLRIELRLVDGQGPFDLVISIDALTVDLLLPAGV